MQAAGATGHTRHNSEGHMQPSVSPQCTVCVAGWLPLPSHRTTTALHIPQWASLPLHHEHSWAALPTTVLHAHMGFHHCPQLTGYRLVCCTMGCAVPPPVEGTESGNHRGSLEPPAADEAIRVGAWWLQINPLRDACDPWTPWCTLSSLFLSSILKTTGQRSNNWVNTA